MIIDRDNKDFEVLHETRNQRLLMLDLEDSDIALSAILQSEVIRPNVQDIMDSFYSALLKYPIFNEILAHGFKLSHLKEVQTEYLLSLGVNFAEASYFENRSRIGLAHVRVGVPLHIYLFAYRKLQQLLIDNIPIDQLDISTVKHLIAFILKITTLDISLAAETYHLSRMHDLQVNLDELSCKHSKLEYEAGLDFLTGLANRQRIMKLLSNSYQKRKRENMPLSVIMADLDRFKSVNDEYGHQVGDIVLQTVAARIAAAVREKDIIGRYGGEEFIVVLADKNLDQAAQIAERIRMQIADTPIKTPNISINMTISLGVAEAYGNEHMGKLIARADSALYQAKMNGRNSVVLDCITKPQNKGDASFVV